MTKRRNFSDKFKAAVALEALRGDKPLTLSHVNPQSSALSFRRETAAKRALGMQLPQPTCVAHISFATRHILGVSGVHQDHLKAMRLQNLERWYPINAGRIRRCSGDAARLYGPVALETLKIGTTAINDFEDAEIAFLNVDQAQTPAHMPDLVPLVTAWRQGAAGSGFIPKQSLGVPLLPL